MPMCFYENPVPVVDLEGKYWFESVFQLLSMGPVLLGEPKSGGKRHNWLEIIEVLCFEIL